jgi:DNA-binding Lrp family transcriptional regulator
MNGRVFKDIAAARGMTDVDRRLLDDFQQSLPLSPTPFADMAARLGVSEDEVLGRLRHFQEQGIVSRVGPVLAPNRVGASVLAAMAVPESELESIAALVSSFPEVNHNYEREHDFNLWFVVAARDQDELDAVLVRIEAQAGHRVLRLPMLESYHVDLGFPLTWN